MHVPYLALMMYYIILPTCSFAFLIVQWPSNVWATDAQSLPYQIYLVTIPFNGRHPTWQPYVNPLKRVNHNNVLGLVVPCITTKSSTVINPIWNEKWLISLDGMRHNVFLSNTVQFSEFDVKYSYDWKGEFQISATMGFRISRCFAKLLPCFFTTFLWLHSLGC